ncbi:MAG: histidine kinase dimerization/phospho-acceptor domain-containing protein [Gemmatimonadaceae bacterium]
MSANAQSASGPETEAIVPEICARVAHAQHEMNNPLSALLAEAQILAMDPLLSESQQESVDRMIQLVRRVIGLVRNLDQVCAEPSGASI